jgi:catecholate siderophore receptor
MRCRKFADHIDGFPKSERSGRGSIVASTRGMRRFLLTDLFGRIYAPAMSDYFGRVLLTIVVATFPAVARAQQAPVRFDIPAGQLSQALAAFEAASGLHVTLVDQIDASALQSPGVTGSLTPLDALRRLTAGTGLTVFATPKGFDLRVAASTIHVAIDQQATPYRAIDSATATKTSTPLRDIPQTVTVVPIELLRDQRAQSVADAVRNVPGVSVAQGEGNRDQVVIRGISTQSDFFVNGVRDDQERFRDLYNVESMEVVQGPAAVLFGRGGAGGVVNLVTMRPERGAPSDASFETGAYGHKRATVRFTLPVGESGAFRMATVGEDSGGFRDGFYLQRYGFNPTMGLKFGSRASLTVGAEHLRDERLADRGIPSQAGRPVAVPVSQLFGSRTQNVAESGVDSGRATFEYRFSSRLVLRNNFLTGWYDKSYQNVYPGTAVSAAGTLSLSAYNHDINRVNTFNQTDVIYTPRFLGADHVVLAGVEAGWQNQDELRHQAAAIPNVPVTDSERDANFAAAPLTVDRHADATVLAGYVQDQIALSGQWKAVVGARLDRFAVRVDDHLPGTTDLSRTDVNVSPRAGVIYQPSKAVSIYASYSYTFLPSGQTLGLARNTAEVAPENAKNYETGTKLELGGGRVSVSAAIFRLDRDNVKNTDPNDPTRLVLTGQQRTDGVVASAAGNLTARWKITGGYANSTARVTRDTTAAPAGRQVGLVPRHQATLWSTYDITRNWGAGGGIVSQSRVFTSFTNAVTLPSFTRADAVVYYRSGRYRLALNVDNIFDAAYYPTANGDNNISPGLPRSVQATVRVLF